MLLQGQSDSVSVQLEAQGNENALGFSLSFDPAMLSYTGASLGSGASGATLNVNASQAGSGRLGFALALPTGSSFAAGTRELMKVTFRASTDTSGASSLSLTDQPVPRDVSDPLANDLSATYLNGTVTVNPVPRLSVVRSGQNVALSWPLWATNFNLQEAAGALRPANSWTNLPATVFVSNGQNIVTLPISRTNTFYRLYHP